MIPYIVLAVALYLAHDALESEVRPAAMKAIPVGDVDRGGVLCR